MCGLFSRPRDGTDDKKDYRSEKMQEKIDKVYEQDFPITKDTGDWICHLDSIWMGENGPRFSLVIDDKLKGIYPERMPDTHKKWLKNHECWLCNDSVDRIPRRIRR